MHASMNVRRSLLILLALVALLFVGAIVASPSVSPLVDVASAQEDDDDGGDDDDDG